MDIAYVLQYKYLDYLITCPLLVICPLLCLRFSFTKLPPFPFSHVVRSCAADCRPDVEPEPSVQVFMCHKCGASHPLRVRMRFLPPSGQVLVLFPRIKARASNSLSCRYMWFGLGFSLFCWTWFKIIRVSLPPVSGSTPITGKRLPLVELNLRLKPFERVQVVRQRLDQFVCKVASRMRSSLKIGVMT